MFVAISINVVESKLQAYATKLKGSVGRGKGILYIPVNTQTTIWSCRLDFLTLLSDCMCAFNFPDWLKIRKTNQVSKGVRKLS